MRGGGEWGIGWENAQRRFERFSGEILGTLLVGVKYDSMSCHIGDGGYTVLVWHPLTNYYQKG